MMNQNDDSKQDSENQVQNETSFETSLKQVLKSQDYNKLIPIIRMLEKEKEINIQEVMAITKKSRTTAWRYMRILIDLGVVETEGDTNNTVYRIHQ